MVSKIVRKRLVRSPRGKYTKGNISYPHWLKYATLGGDGNRETLLLFSNAFRGKIETFASDLTEEDKATLGIVAE